MNEAASDSAFNVDIVNLVNICIIIIIIFIPLVDNNNNTNIYKVYTLDRYGYWHQRADERHDKPPKVTRSYLWSKTKVERPPGELRVSKST